MNIGHTKHHGHFHGASDILLYMKILSIPLVFANILLSYLILIRKHTAQRILFIFFIICSAIWIITIQLALYTQNTSLSKFIFAIPILGLYCLVLFSYTFYKQHTKKTIIIFGIPTLLMLYLVFSGKIIKSTQIISGHIEMTYYPFIIWHKIFVISYIFISLFLLAQNAKKNKLQTLWVFFSIALFLIPAAITNMVLPQIFGIQEFNAYGPLFSIFMLMGITYAITKHKLMDIRISIQKGVVYTLLISTIVIIFTIILFVAEFLLGEYMRFSNSISGVITTLAGVIYGQKILDYFTEKTDPFFYKHPYKLQHALSGIQAITKTHTNNKTIFIRNCVQTIQNILHPETLSFLCFTTGILIKDDMQKSIKDGYPRFIIQVLKKLNVIIHITPKAIRKNKVHPVALAWHYRMGITILAPIIHNNQTIGILCMGEKKSGESYTSKDIKFITLAIGYISIAMKNIDFYEKQKHYTNRLEKAVLERTHELKTLQQAQKQSMLDISHGIQGPLTLLRAQLEICQNKIKNKTPLKYCIQLVDNTSKIAYDLITLARLNTMPKNTCTHTIVNISKTISELLPALKQSAESQKVLLTVNITPNIKIKGIENDIKRLIMNIVKNAIKYTAISKSKSKDIVISLTENTAYNTAIFSVKDTGIGIPKESIPKLFDTFYRVNDDIETNGAGIGLTICKRIVDAHKGIIKIDSTLHKGTTVTVTLPLKETCTQLHKK